MRLVLLGLPGAGKGTQGELLARKYGVPHISTGAIFRDAINANNSLGERARAVIDRGELVPDDLAGEIILVRLSEEDCADGFILDGFPRTVPQAEALDLALPTLGIEIDAAVNIRISEGEAIKRIAGRLICSQCGATYNRKLHPAKDAGVCDLCQGPLVQRPDDTEETARNRLRIYLEQTHPVVTYYEGRSVLLPVEGEGRIEDVFQLIETDLGNKLGIR